jgi:methionine-gamma-lyase
MINDVYQQGFATRAIHHGYDPRDHQGALVPPVYLTSTFTFETAQDGGRCFAGTQAGYFYTRIGNPTLALFESRMACLEGGAAAVAFGSGMGAICSTLWTLLRPGDEIIVDRALYGCTFAFLHHGLEEFGIKVCHVDLREPQNLKTAISSNTKLVYIETPVNPTMTLVDITAVAAIAHQHDLKVVVDNTYCSPYLQQPLLLGADVVVHSATKYIGGHGDVTAGVAVMADAQVALQIRMQGLKDLTGAVLSPQDAFLLLRGLKTLELRLERHCDNAEAVVELLLSHPAVQTVYYPGIPSSPQYELAKRQMRRFGGIVAFELKGGEHAGKVFLNALKLVARAVSLGDSESLAQHPASMTHSSYTPEERARSGISDGLVRLSVGLENAQDLLHDLRQSLSKID